MRAGTLSFIGVCSLVVFVAAQNLEPTTIDILFWSLPGVPKLFALIGSAVAGAIIWELGRRWIFKSR